jgi:hypothetical protein
LFLQEQIKDNIIIVNTLIIGAAVINTVMNTHTPRNSFIIGVVECAPDTYSSSTHRFPDERTPIEATPLSATSAELGLGLGLGLGLDSISHSSSHALPFFLPPSFHTLSFFPAFTIVWLSA